MKTSKTPLEYCKKEFERCLEKKVIDPSIEVYAVNNLKNRKEILSFRSSYIEFMKKFISYEIESKKKTPGTKLIQKGYSLQKVAAFFVDDGITYTLGHIYNKRILKLWDKNLPQPYFSKNMFKD
ncbi:MAG: hypothetical protein Q8Q04_02815 [archaeon]|nr:hypothetical protein [archaeon]